MPDNATSAVPPAEDWTPQEKFVWERVAAGEIADFNTADGYGGNLDPKMPEGWPDNRVLRSAFLETILLKDPYRRNLTRHGVIIIGARFTQAIELEGAELGHRLGLPYGLIEKGANLRRLKSKYLIVLSGSKVVGSFETDGLDLDTSLFMRDGEFDEMDFVAAHVGGQLSLSGSKVTGKLSMGSLRVDDNLDMEKAEFAEVDLTGANIGGQLDLGGSKVTGKVNMNSVHVEQNLVMSRKAEFADIELIGAHIGKYLDLIDSKFNGTLNCDSVDVGGAVLLSRGAAFLGPINLIFAKIGQNLELAGGTFGNQVDMTGARIGGEFRLGSARHLPAIWQAGAALILRNASVDTIQDLSDAWPPRLDLNDFNYRSLGGIHATQQDPMLDRPLEWFEAWLRRQERYAAQPYERLAICLKNNGKSEMATAIRYAGSERERKESSGWWRYIWLTIFKYTVGYGYQPWRALVWAAALVLLGAAVLHISGEGLRNNMPYGLAYSFDMLLPIVKLREWHYKVDLMGWARYYFYGHKIMGYLLASFLIAGLSGLRADSVSRE
jgi:hypothetical protein